MKVTQRIPLGWYTPRTQGVTLRHTVEKISLTHFCGTVLQCYEVTRWAHFFFCSALQVPTVCLLQHEFSMSRCANAIPVRRIFTYLPCHKSLWGLMLQYQCDLKQFHFPFLINLPAPKCTNLSRCKKTYFPEDPFNCWELHCFCSVGEILIGSGCSGCFYTRAREPLYPHHHQLLFLHQKCTSSHWLYCLSRQHSTDNRKFVALSHILTSACQAWIRWGVFRQNKVAAASPLTD